MLALDGPILAEFLAARDLARLQIFDNDLGGRTLFLVIGSSTFNLLHLTREEEFDLQLFRLEDGLIGYGVYVPDGARYEPLLWSIVESSDELSWLTRVATGSPFSIALMNEVAANTAKSSARVVECDTFVPALMRNALPSQSPSSSLGPAARATFNALGGKWRLEGMAAVCRVKLDSEWERLESIYLTSSNRRPTVDIFASDQGGQHESLVTVLLEALAPVDIYRNPRLKGSRNLRELTDILLNYANGLILIEAKAVEVSRTASSRTRERLMKNAAKDVHKASRQLVGAARSISDGAEIVEDSSGQRKIEINRAAPLHLIVLMSNLELLDGCTEFGVEFYSNLMKRSNAFVHLLDMGQLVRVASAAKYFSARSEISPIEWFDYLLIRRAKHAISVGHPNFDLRFLPEGSRIEG